jgi:aminoglycoside phosphotransferase (APT) family kinase protein
VTVPLIAAHANWGPVPGNEHAASDLRALLNLPGSQTVLLDSSRDPNSGVTMLLIPVGRDQPELAVKLATTAAAARVIDREARLLRALQQRPMDRVEATLPRLGGVFHADGMLAVATSVVPGVPMRTRYHGFRHLRRPEAVRADFAAASAWLANLHADSATEARSISLLEGVPALITARWPHDPRASALADKLAPVAARLASAKTPRTVVHGDFWAGNILLTGEEVTGVVDWPAGSLSGEPLADVARFALSYALYLDRHTRPGRHVAGHPGLRVDGWGTGIRYAIAGEHWFGQVVTDFVTGALTRLGVPAELWRDVLLGGLAETAATADHPDFAACHRDLLLHLISEGAR